VQSFWQNTALCDLIIRNEIQHIVVGTVDPNEKVAGNGIRKLKEAGKEVIVGVLEAECREFNRRFFTFHEKQRPYIILKWAESADGYLSPKHKDDIKPVWITNPYSRQLVHKWRSEEMAILVGTQTVLDDNPQLDVRTWTGKNPVRIVLDRTGRVTYTYSVKNQKIKTIVLTEMTNFVNLDTLVYETVVFNDELPQTIAQVLFKNNLQSVIVEGGCKTLQTFIDANLWDEARVFKGNTVFNEGTPAPRFSADAVHRQTILDDELITYRNYGQRNYF